MNLNPALPTLLLCTAFGCANPVSPESDAGLLADANSTTDAETGSDAGTIADGSPNNDTGPSCTPDTSCTTNPNPNCSTGRTDCTGGVETCVDAVASADGTTCTGGLCTNGVCLEPETVDSDIDLSTIPIPGGTCAGGTQFVVESLSLRSASLATAPDAGCLAPNDEVLLINLQGSPGFVDNVGDWELLRVGSVAGTNVSFTTDKTRFYGQTLGSDEGVNITQRVALIRVPQFGELTIADGVTVSAPAWDGALGGVIALRAASLDLRGSIDGSELGYRPGLWSVDGPCVDNLPTYQGESISGPGEVGVGNNAGGAGGLSGATNLDFNGDTPVCSTAGHALAGLAGTNANSRTIGDPGEAYGIDDGSKLTMGSGSSGNLTCSGTGSPLGYLNVAPSAGGIVLLLVEELAVASTATITVTAANAPRDVAGSGGYILIRGGNLSIDTDRVTALGAVAVGASAATMNVMLEASPGYVVLQSSGIVSGESRPAATVIMR